MVQYMTNNNDTFWAHNCVIKHYWIQLNCKGISDKFTRGKNNSWLWKKTRCYSLKIEIFLFTIKKIIHALRKQKKQLLFGKKLKQKKITQKHSIESEHTRTRTTWKRNENKNVRGMLTCFLNWCSTGRLGNWLQKECYCAWAFLKVIS